MATANPRKSASFSANAASCASHCYPSIARRCLAMSAISRNVTNPVVNNDCVSERKVFVSKSSDDLIRFLINCRTPGNCSIAALHVWRRFASRKFAGNEADKKLSIIFCRFRMNRTVGNRLKSSHCSKPPSESAGIGMNAVSSISLIANPYSPERTVRRSAIGLKVSLPP